MANRIYKKVYNLRGSDFNRFLEIKPSAVLDLFQDIAGIHAVDSGSGFHAMLERGFLWVVMKVKYEIIKMPSMYQTVNVVTWPKEPHRLDFERDYLILNEQDEVLIKGTSQWALINSDTRKIARVTNVYDQIDEFCHDNAFEEKIVRIQDFNEVTPATRVTSGFSELDSNGHVNNTRYADYVINAINPKEPMNIKVFQLDFHKEIMCGNDTDIFVEEKENVIYAKGMQNENIMFSCRMEKN